MGRARARARAGRFAEINLQEKSKLVKEREKGDAHSSTRTVKVKVNWFGLVPVRILHSTLKLSLTLTRALR